MICISAIRNMFIDVAREQQLLLITTSSSFSSTCCTGTQPGDYRRVMDQVLEYGFAFRPRRPRLGKALLSVITTGHSQGVLHLPRDIIAAPSSNTCYRSG